jgi:hypothetical protein
MATVSRDAVPLRFDRPTDNRVAAAQREVSIKPARVETGGMSSYAARLGPRPVKVRNAYFRCYV